MNIFREDRGHARISVFLIEKNMAHEAMAV